MIQISTYYTKNTVSHAVGNGEVRGRDVCPSTVALWQDAGVQWQGREPSAQKVQAREKQKGFQEGPVPEVARKEVLPEAGKPGPICYTPAPQDLH